MTTEQKLDQISEFDAQRVLLNQDYANKVAEIMLPVQAQIDALMASVQPALNDLDAEYKPKMTAIDANCVILEAEVRAETIATGKTVKGQYIQCIYSSPRVTWDTKHLDGVFFSLHDILKKIDAFVAIQDELSEVRDAIKNTIETIVSSRKVGEPSVSFRAVGKA